MKIVFVGKGGAGKTTIAACLARLIGREGYNVIAIDADPSLNLARSLGIDVATANSKPVLFDEEFIKTRTLLPDGAYRLNPRVDDVIERFGVKGPDNVTLLRLGYVKKGGVRCLCPEYSFLRALLSHLILGRREVVVVDMVAGLEPMSRGTVRGIDLMVCVAEPTAKSLDVVLEIYRLAKDIGVSKFAVIGNKIVSEEDRLFIESRLRGVKILGYIPFDENVIKADKLGMSLIDYNPYSSMINELKNVKNKIFKNKIYNFETGT
jgi:CO dehydrogenase maturation factor